MAQDVVDDWKNREFIETVEVAVRKCVDFLNNFHESAKYRLSVVDARLSTLERKLDFLEASLENCDPQKRNAKPSQFKSSIFDPQIRMKLIAQNEQKRKQNQRLFNKIIVAPNKSLVSRPIINAGQSSPRPQQQQQPKQQPKQPQNQKPKQQKQQKQQPKQQKQQQPKQQQKQQPPKQQPPKQQPKQKQIPPPVPSPAAVQVPPPIPNIAKKQPKPPSNPVQENKKKEQQQQQQQPPPAPVTKKPPIAPGAAAPAPPPPGPGAGPGAAAGPPPAPGPGPGAPPPPKQDSWPNRASDQIDIFTVTAGKGAIPGGQSAVEIEYTGHLPNGKQFIKHREVIQLGKKQNIKGLEQAVVRIKVGSVIKLWIPSKLAYGARGAGKLIPPNSDLTFQLQLHRIVKQ